MISHVKKMLVRGFVTLGFIFSSLFAIQAEATSAQDTWYVPNESGWGINVIQQDSAFGFAMYVYDSGQVPIWYLGDGSGSGTTWSGNMFAYRGPYFGGTFNPGAVSSTPVGTFSFTLNTVQSATLTYNINGITATKVMSRLALTTQNMSGSYIGAFVVHNTCATQTFEENPTFFNINDNGSAISMASADATTSCNYSGTHTQEGRYGKVVGTFTCNNGKTGNFNWFEIDVASQGLIGRYTGTSSLNGNNCTVEGRIGGISRSTTSF